MCECSTVAVGELGGPAAGARPQMAGASLAGCSSSSVTAPAPRCRTRRGLRRFQRRRAQGGRTAHPGQRVGAAAPVASSGSILAVGRETGARPPAGSRPPRRTAGWPPRPDSTRPCSPRSPAAAVAFKLASNGVSEVLISPPHGVSSAALAGHLPASCAHFKEGRRHHSDLQRDRVSRQRDRPAGPDLNVSRRRGHQPICGRSVYRGKGFVGTVTGDRPQRVGEGRPRTRPAGLRVRRQIAVLISVLKKKKKKKKKKGHE